MSKYGLHFGNPNFGDTKARKANTSMSSRSPLSILHSHWELHTASGNRGFVDVSLRLTPGESRPYDGLEQQY